MQAPYLHTTAEACDDGNDVNGDGCSTICECDGTYYLDADGDGFSDGTVETGACSPSANYYAASDLIASSITNL